MPPYDDNPAGVTLSLLDRLTDFDPENSREAPPNPWQVVRDYKASLCRDLTALLNTRRGQNDFDPQYKQASNSLLTYGIADFTSFNLKNVIDQEEVRLSIERAIRQFEPRLSRVEVTLEEPDPLRPVLRFQISALLRAGSGSEPVFFDASLHRDSRRIAVSGGLE